MARGVSPSNFPPDFTSGFGYKKITRRTTGAKENSSLRVITIFYQASCYLWLSLAISCYLQLYLAISLMYSLLPNDSLTFTFYETFSNSIPNWTSLVKKVFWFDAYFRKWQNDCFVTKWQLNFHFSCDNLK